MNKFYVLLLFTFFIAAKPRLIDFSYNHYSQFGEDGIVKKIFEIIGTQSMRAIEFGAWDGFHFSNSAALWSTDSSWQGILIEGDTSRFHQLKTNTLLFNVIALNEWVGIGTHDSLEAILKKHSLPFEVDLLSIDIDGNDYHIFASLNTLRPRLIICEYNPTIPVTYDVYAPYHTNNNFGQSVAALNRIAKEKGYILVALTIVNAFYVRAQDFKKFEQFETDVLQINVNDGYITVVTTYDGKYAFIKNKHPNYFYGLEEQYTNELCGDCVRLDTQPLTLNNLPAAYQKK